MTASWQSLEIRAQPLAQTGNIAETGRSLPKKIQEPSSDRVMPQEVAL
jgi:hypothetical protein